MKYLYILVFSLCVILALCSYSRIYQSKSKSKHTYTYIEPFDSSVCDNVNSKCNIIEKTINTLKQNITKAKTTINKLQKQISSTKATISDMNQRTKSCSNGKQSKAKKKLEAQSKTVTVG